MPHITHSPIRFGSEAWITFVHTRDEMLRGERPALVASVEDFDPFSDRRCPVCAYADLQAELHNDAFDLYCPECKGEFRTEQHLEACFEEMPWRKHRQKELWLLPGQVFRRSDFPPMRHLPMRYPQAI